MQLCECTRVACVRDVYYTQRSIKHEFADGSSFEDLISEIRCGAIDPSRGDKPFPLRVCRFRQRLLSLDNRRLFCLKKLQEEQTHSDIWVQIVVVELNKLLETFVSHYDHEQTGHTIIIHRLRRRGV